MSSGRFHLLVCIAIFGYATSCQLDAEDSSAPESTDDDFHDQILELEPDVIPTGPVADFVDAGCSTTVVAPLSRQIAEEMLCAAPEAFVRIEPDENLEFESRAVLPFMDAEAAEALRRAAAESPLVLNSGFRSVAQQFLLHAWFDRGRCGIASAAAPGNSNHETGRAIDITATDEQRQALRDHGWIDRLARDPVHFEHRESPDLRGLGVHAFQRLWNRNHPDDPIDEDGSWGEATRARMLMSPVQGFARGPECL